jgi:hypothetical protein
VILKSVNLKKEYELEVNRSNQLSDLAKFLRNMGQNREFED